jgi:hypothetical protein
MFIPEGFEVLLSALVCVGLTACGAALPSDASGQPGELTGVIVSVQAGPTVTGVLVNGSLEGVTSSPGHLYLLVGEDTEIALERADGTVVTGRTADLKAGARIRARHMGVELRSNPPQFPVTKVEILSQAAP